MELKASQIGSIPLIRPRGQAILVRCVVAIRLGRGNSVDTRRAKFRQNEVNAARRVFDGSPFVWVSTQDA